MGRSISTNLRHASDGGARSAAARGIVFAVLLLVMAGAAPPAGALTTDEMCKIIQRDIAAYLATGHPCPCPYSATARIGACGNRAAWAKPDGRAPRCYFEDVDGTLPPNRRPNPTRQHWPDPPPCAVTS